MPTFAFAPATDTTELPRLPFLCASCCERDDTAHLLVPLRPQIEPVRRRPGALRRLLDAADFAVACVLMAFALAVAVLFAGPLGFFVCVFLLAQAAIALHPPVWRLSVHHDHDTGGTR